QEERYIENFKEFNPQPIGLIGLKHVNLKEESAKLVKLEKVDPIETIDKKAVLGELDDYSFAHLHNHTQFSILQSTINVQGLVQKAAEYKMKAVALTDTGNMIAAFHFERAVSNHNASVREKRKEAEENGEMYDGQEIIPIIGC